MKKLVKQNQGSVRTIEVYASSCLKKCDSHCSSTLKQCGGNGTAQSARYQDIKARYSSANFSLDKAY